MAHGHDGDDATFHELWKPLQHLIIGPLGLVSIRPTNTWVNAQEFVYSTIYPYVMASESVGRIGYGCIGYGMVA